MIDFILDDEVQIQKCVMKIKRLILWVSSVNGERYNQIIWISNREFHMILKSNQLSE